MGMIGLFLFIIPTIILVAILIWFIVTVKDIQKTTKDTDKKLQEAINMMRDWK